MTFGAAKKATVSPATLVPTEVDLTKSEQALLDEFDSQRRLQLLRVILPGLLAIALVAVPFAIQADMGSHGMDSSRQVAIGVVAFALGVWAVRARRVNVAAFCLFAGVAGVLIYLILSDGPLRGALDLTAIPTFALLALPVVIAGIFSGPRLVAVATGAMSLFTIGTIVWTPHSAALVSAMAESDGLAVFTVPLATQIAVGVLMFAANRSYRRTIRELGATRIAYVREKELDRLKDQFISSVNHELRTPIMAVQGYLELARELGARGEHTRQEQMLSRGARAMDHLAGLVKSVLNVRRVEADAADLHLADVPLQATIIEATELLDPRVDELEARPLHIVMPSDLAVYADGEKLRQVLLNLLSNAVKYSPPGSPVEISARIRDAGIGAGQRAMVEVAVHDHGLGIPPEQAPLLFNRFVRLERDIASSVWGTGLGLAICRTYVAAMGGRIWVESPGQPGAGATFRFTLPPGKATTTDSVTPVQTVRSALEILRRSEEVL